MFGGAVPDALITLSTVATDVFGASGRAMIDALIAGIHMIGHNGDGFCFDNEQPAHQVVLRPVRLAPSLVTNGEWLEFVRDGGPVPSFWVPDGDGFKLLGAWELLPLPVSWPVWVSNDQARAYASWRGRRVMSEAEYHRAAYGTPSADERPYPWGEELPHALHGNFDFERFDPEPVDAHPAGVRAAVRGNPPVAGRRAAGLPHARIQA